MQKWLKAKFDKDMNSLKQKLHLKIFKLLGKRFKDVKK